MVSHCSRTSEPVGVVELSAALLTLAAIAAELGVAASAVALAASTMAEENASVPPAKETSVATVDKPNCAKGASMIASRQVHLVDPMEAIAVISDKLNAAKDAMVVSGVKLQTVKEGHLVEPDSPSSSHCSTPSSSGGSFCVEESEDEGAGECWEPRPAEGKIAATKPIRANSPSLLAGPLHSPSLLHFRVVWDAKKAANVQRKDGLPVSSVAEFLADRMQASTRAVGWAIHCGPKDWELKVSVHRFGCMDSMLHDITGLVKDVVEAELESSRGNGGRNTIGSVRARPYDEVAESAAAAAPSFMSKQASEPAPTLARHQTLRVKNTFIHVDDPQKSELIRKRMSDPLGMSGLAGTVAAAWAARNEFEPMTSIASSRMEHASSSEFR